MGRLFRSKRQRDKDDRRERRKAFRQADNVVDDVKARIRQLDRDAKKQWNKAREALKSGEKAAAQRLLTGYRAAQVLMAKLEQKRWVFEQYRMKMDTAQSDAEFASALGAINKVVSVDPEQVADVFEASQEILGEQLDADRLWDRVHEKEMDGAESELEDRVPDTDDLMSQLEDETASEVGGAERMSDALDGRIGEGQDRIRKLLDGK